MAKKKDENQQEQSNNHQEMITDWAMSLTYPLADNSKTNWDVESEEEKAARKKSEPGHWHS